MGGSIPKTQQGSRENKTGYNSMLMLIRKIYVEIDVDVANDTVVTERATVAEVIDT